MHPAQTVSWQMDSKDVGRDSVLYKPPCSLTSFFTTAFIILQENRMGCTCGRHLFFIETVSCTFSWLLPFHTGFKGWQSIARGLVQWGYNGDGHCPEWTQVWKGPLKQQPNSQPVSLLSGSLLFSHKGQNQFEHLPAGKAVAEVFLVLGVLESGRGKADSGQGGPPPRKPEVSLETGPRTVGRTVLWGGHSHPTVQWEHTAPGSKWHLGVGQEQWVWYLLHGFLKWQNDKEEEKVGRKRDRME